MRAAGCVFFLTALLSLVHCSGSPGAAPWNSQAKAADVFERQRLDMVHEQIEARGVEDRRVLEAMRQVQRHLFVPDHMRSQAYDDHPLPIGEGQTISQPYVVAVMTELLAPQRSHRVLEIGTGSGYQAAVLSLLAGEVDSIEIVDSLATQAANRLGELGYTVNVRSGNGYLGWPEKAPFDRIILTAAPTKIPQALVEQLKPGGRLVAPVGPVGADQELVVLDKGLDGAVRTRTVLPVRFVPMVKEPPAGRSPGC